MYKIFVKALGKSEGSSKLPGVIPKESTMQTADLQFRLLRELFDGHYKEQIHLVDVLIERIRALDGAGRVFAGDFLHRTHFSQLLRGRVLATQLLAELVDARESILNAALPAGANAGKVNRSWTRDFAVGQVVLTNDEQL